MMDWVSAWQHSLGLSSHAPEWAVALAALLCIYGFVILPASGLMSYLERKLSADLQARVGPNQAGFAGILQPIADILKLVQKEVNSNSWRETLWLSVHTIALYSTVALLPLGSTALMIDTDMSVFLPFLVTLVIALSTMLLGLSRLSVPGWFGGIRVAAQALAGAFPALIAILCAGVRAGGFQWSMLAGAQGASPLQWAALSSPFELLAFLVFVVSGMVLLGIAPLDGGLSLPDIHGGVSSHVHGRRLSLFSLGRFYGFFLWSIISAALFLGGWALPDSLAELIRNAGAWRLLLLLELLVLLFKAFGLMVIVVLISCVTPRVRSDQITDMAWKVLSPLSLIGLVGTALWVGWFTVS